MGFLGQLAAVRKLPLAVVFADAVAAFYSVVRALALPLDWTLGSTAFLMRSLGFDPAVFHDFIEGSPA